MDEGGERNDIERRRQLGVSRKRFGALRMAGSGRVKEEVVLEFAAFLRTCQPLSRRLLSYSHDYNAYTCPAFCDGELYAMA